ncbi:MAG TPA: hypothetical protein VED41_05915 [Solirubrobacteraceae bacterium]|nr:hypothetical protein [Solirubrobacteraceae bacterium]
MISRAFWGGVALVAMWLAVLFVGVFGGSILHTSASGESSSVPVVVVVAVAALLATIPVAHAAFRPQRSDEDLRRAVEDERRALENLSTQVGDLRASIGFGKPAHS